jgi:transcriptional regulator of acetoin/glycerol metabolism/biotin operon repressor
MELPRPSRYEILRPIGRGGMGQVFLARDRYLGKQVALKRLLGLACEGTELELFKREFSSLYGVEHPGIARAHDFGFLDGHPYFTCDYIEGDSLAAAGLPRDAGECLELLRRLVETVAFLHRSGILHLDIKPSNVILASGSPSPAPVLVDFGLVRRGASLPAGGVLRGSRPFMAPEYFKSGDLGAWTDVYALAASFCRLLGSSPSDGGSGGAAIERGGALGPLVLRRRGLPDGLEALLLKCLASDPALRFRSAVELAEALRSFREAAVSNAAPAPAIETIGRERELAEIDRFLDGIGLGASAAPGARRVLVFTGEAGSGQSHLFRELKVRAQLRGRQVYLETGYAGAVAPPGALLRCLGEHIGGAGRRRWLEFLQRLSAPRRAAPGAALDGERRIRRARELASAASYVRELVLIAVDGVQHFDEVSIELLIELVRLLDEGAPAPRPPLALALGYREEGPMAACLKDLSSLLVGTGRALVLTLQGLSVEASAELFRRLEAPLDGSGRIARGGASGLEIFQQSGGRPGRIVSLAPAAAATPAADLGRGRAALGQRRPRPEAEARPVLLALRILERPAPAEELARLLGLGREQVRRCLDRLSARGLAFEAAGGGRQAGWLCSPAAEALSDAGGAEIQRLHRRIGESLARAAAGDSDPRLAEALRHFQAAGSTRRFLQHAWSLAAYQRRSFQNRQALHTYRAIDRALPAAWRRQRVEAALAITDLHAVTGDLDGGIHFLRRFLFELRSRAARGDGPRLRRRVLLGLATLYSRRGDFRRADALFRAGLAAAAGELSWEDRLRFLNEHAALKTFLGDYDAALELCRVGLELAEKESSAAVRELALNLLATRANVALRRFDFARAGDDFEAALDVAETLGSPDHQAVILNNLGTVYAQSDRFSEAIRVFRDAEATCRQLDEGPSLAGIYANLGILYAKIGDGAGCERAFREIENLEAAAIGKREAFFVAHARGLAALYRGRYCDAVQAFDKAMALGQALGDRHVVDFERLYRCEALLFAGGGDAAGELERLARDGSSTLRRMARARLAWHAAWRGDAAAVAGHLGDGDAAAREEGAAFIAAWDRLYAGWARAWVGECAAAGEDLDAAESYFARHGLRAALALARAVRAEAHMIAGDEARALEFLLQRQPAASGHALEELLAVLLEARLRAAHAVGDAERIDDLLAQAGVLLLGNPMPEFQARWRALRERNGSELPGRRVDPAGHVGAECRGSYLESPHRKAWERLPAARAPSGGRRGIGEEAGTAPLPAPPVAVGGRALAARSKGMRALIAALDRLRGSDLPVLISGETGSGKELVARIIHDESRRAGKVFQVIDAAAIPAPLMAVELFGAVAGAYTDQDRGREGILSAADGGSVFLDEIAATSLEFQGLFLRLLESRAVRPVGAESQKPIDVRFIVSTARNLEEEVAAGRFRADLYHRIHVVAVRVPPLRERVEDLPELVEQLLPGAGVELDDDAFRLLRACPWPGNVRELRNLLQRLRLEHPIRIPPGAVERALGEPLTSTLFPKQVLAGAELPDLHRRLDRDYLIYHLRRLGGDPAALCRFLGVSRRQLYNRCERLGVSLREERRRLAKGR